jgi:tetratricopeptide (TPR) repeat protein
MMNFPFTLPKSLESYLETFSTEPVKTIERLELHLKKRGYDAVGYFLLSWLYISRDDKSKAIENALIAKTYAPGSPFLEYLHYFFVHPHVFEASVPQHVHRDSRKRTKSISGAAFLLDLESLISRLSHVESQKITVHQEKLEANEDVDLSARSIDIDEIATETLAKIHLLQGNYKEAIQIYTALMVKDPDKKSYFEKQVSELKTKIQN